MYERLQSSVKINRLTVPNRVVMPAMGVFIAAPGGGVSDDIVAYYERRARGGVGLIITEVTRVTDGAGAGEPCQLACYRPSDVLELQRLVDAVHKYETRLFIQLQHPGREASSLLTGAQPVAPSAIPSPQGEMPRALSTEEVEQVIGQFVTAATFAQMAGADGVELHAAHGYLLAEFLSPAANHREDIYGGSLENRVRIVAEILSGIRASCGPHFPVSVRINAEEDAGLEGAITLEEAARIAQAIESAGADAINVSCYNASCIEPGTYPQGSKRHLDEAIRKAVQIPVIGVCNIKEPAEAEKLLESGAVDLVGVGRGHLADPDWCRKAFNGHENEIRQCIGCLACFGELTKLHRAKCAVNPVMGREREYANPPHDGDHRVVAVVGGGPAGIEAALVLKERGFHPVLMDSADRLGGTLNTADRGYGKEKITSYVRSLICQVHSAGIETRLGEPATVESVRAMAPVGVFVACGAEPLVPPIPGIRGENVCVAEDVLLSRVKPRGRVAIIGSGMTGLETAEMLAMAGCELTIVEMLPRVGNGIYPTVVSDVMSRILPHHPTILVGHRLDGISKSGLELTCLQDGSRVQAEVDHVVLALGVRPREQIADAFRKAFANVRVIGDAARGGRILEATQDAHGQAFVFEPYETCY